MPLEICMIIAGVNLRILGTVLNCKSTRPTRSFLLILQSVIARWLQKFARFNRSNITLHFTSITRLEIKKIWGYHYLNVLKWNWSRKTNESEKSVVFPWQTKIVAILRLILILLVPKPKKSVACARLSVAISSLNCVSDKMLEFDWLWTALIYG